MRRFSELEKQFVASEKFSRAQCFSLSGLYPETVANRRNFSLKMRKVSVAPCGQRLFNSRRGQAPTLPSSFRFRPTIRQSLFAIRCRFGSAGASPSHLVSRPTSPRPVKSRRLGLRHQMRGQLNAIWQD